jgi:hypothetical protein
MRSRLELTGQRFGRLVVLARVGKNKYRASLWNCLCDCGVEKVVPAPSLRRGLTRSCNCLSKETRVASGRKNAGKTHALRHGHCSGSDNSLTYNSFQAMRRRCLDPKAERYPHYGGANPPVTVCDRWNPDKGGSFENFLADLGERLPNTTLGRYRDVGPYEKSNCAWMTPADQVTNRRPDRNMGGRNKKAVEQTEIAA